MTSFHRAQLFLVAFTLIIAFLLYFLLGSLLVAPITDWFLQTASNTLGLTIPRPLPQTLLFFLIWAIIYWLIITFLSPNLDAVNYLEQLFDRQGRERAKTTWDITVPANDQVRADIIANVRYSWIEPILDRALHDTVRIELGLEYDTAALTRSLRHVEGSRRHPIPAGKSIKELFDESGRSLLILGAPGSGKTFTLVELCQRLLEAAAQDKNKPLPVILNLATWAEQQPLLEAWLVERMSQEYQLSRIVTSAWLDTSQLCLLLDGLDEVREDAQEACVTAINTFRESYPLPLVVCSREQDYEKLGAKLNLTTAIAILPLSAVQVTGYLTHPQLQLYAVHDAIREDDALQKLAQTPLFLSIMTLAYRGFSLADLRPLIIDRKQRQRHLYNTYICRMFTRPREDAVANQYPPRQSLHRLIFLAQQLTQRNQYQFFFEELRPDWLPPLANRHFHFTARLVFRLVAGLVVGLFGGLAAGLFGGLAAGLFVGLISGLIGDQESDYRAEEELSWRRPARRDIILFLWRTAVFTFAFTLISVFNNPLLGTITLTLVITLGLWLSEGLISGLVVGLGGGLISGLGGGLGAGLGGGLYLGLFSENYPLLTLAPSRQRSTVNQGIIASSRTAIRMGLIGGLVSGLVFGLVFGFSYGGQALVNHHLLRWHLSREELLPYHLQPFLDAMAARIFLQCTGPSYRFIHRTLQEHFASLTAKDIARLTAEITSSQSLQS